MHQGSDSADWDAIWKSLDWDDDARRAEAERERLHQRARQYAAPVRDAAESLEDRMTLLTFELGAERYGIDVMVVRGVREHVKIVPVPGTPLFYPGVINVRGRIVTLFDLRAFLDVSVEAEYTAADEVVVVQSGELTLALLAHRVHGVESLARGLIKTVEHLPYTIGVTSERLIVLNLARLMEDPRLIVGASEA